MQENEGVKGKEKKSVPSKRYPGQYDHLAYFAALLSSNMESRRNGDNGKVRHIVFLTN